MFQAEFALLNAALENARKQSEATKSADLKGVASALERNVARLRAVASYPFLLIGVTSAVESVKVKTCLDVLGKPEFGDSDAPKRDELQKRFHELMRQRPQMSPDDPRNYVASAYILDNVLKEPGPIRVAFDAILASLLMNTWTAFESCVTDLWTKAVDLSPKVPVANFIKAQAKNQEKSVLLSVLLERDFDLTQCMGSYLKESRKAEFESLKSIQDQYGKAFGNDAERVFDCAQLRTLERVRNLFAHRGGLVDQKFLRETRDEQAALGTLTEGQPLELEMQTVRLLVGVGVERALMVLQFIDNWLADAK